MNIVIRDDDVIIIPLLERGEFYVMGEVHRPGVYDLTGRKVTVKMALAAAGNFGPLAWPENSILVRRVADGQEQIIPLNLEAIIRGDEPDLFLKPNDVLAVGTNISALPGRPAERLPVDLRVWVYLRSQLLDRSRRVCGTRSDRFTHL